MLEGQPFAILVMIKLEYFPKILLSWKFTPNCIKRKFPQTFYFVEKFQKNLLCSNISKTKFIFLENFHNQFALLGKFPQTFAVLLVLLKNLHPNWFVKKFPKQNWICQKLPQTIRFVRRISTIFFLISKKVGSIEIFPPKLIC